MSRCVWHASLPRTDHHHAASAVGLRCVGAALRCRLNGAWRARGQWHSPEVARSSGPVQSRAVTPGSCTVTPGSCRVTPGVPAGPSGGPPAAPAATRTASCAPHGTSGRRGGAGRADRRAPRAAAAPPASRPSTGAQNPRGGVQGSRVLLCLCVCFRQICVCFEGGSLYLPWHCFDVGWKMLAFSTRKTSTFSTDFSPRPMVVIFCNF